MLQLFKASIKSKVGVRARVCMRARVTIERFYDATRRREVL